MSSGIGLTDYITLSYIKKERLGNVILARGVKFSVRRNERLRSRLSLGAHASLERCVFTPSRLGRKCPLRYYVTWSSAQLSGVWRDVSASMVAATYLFT